MKIEPKQETYTVEGLKELEGMLEQEKVVLSDAKKEKELADRMAYEAYQAYEIAKKNQEAAGFHIEGTEETIKWREEQIQKYRQGLARRLTIMDV
jgi:hypothetical protein